MISRKISQSFRMRTHLGKLSRKAYLFISQEMEAPNTMITTASDRTHVCHIDPCPKTNAEKN